MSWSTDECSSACPVSWAPRIAQGFQLAPKSIRYGRDRAFANVARAGQHQSHIGPNGSPLSKVLTSRQNSLAQKGSKDRRASHAFNISRSCFACPFTFDTPIQGECTLGTPTGATGAEGVACVQEGAKAAAAGLRGCWPPHAKFSKEARAEDVAATGEVARA